ncbi:nicotinate-nucleotide--dimethylbenzimidazole phosphoribosyltransferase [Brevibacillus massiliensis]|uniref:nicotinate-nucleotide--dimethylbenzimidazole phosphoribosyltransferase n=1 Tax=Brevibacillus massiliensis TaxID=1118054 RepID=UPI0002E3F2D1|nr:nicotinate-nucleotide--dimethylbenzimidazole phosphoribosyltransferase [Brevibacillus massiliensis]
MKWMQQVPPLDFASGEAARMHIDQLTKPTGSLGRLEELAIQLAKITGEPFPQVSPPGVIVFAGDHGIVKEGVSAYPQEVTAQMVLNFTGGGAAINVFSRQIGALLQVVDVGVASDLSAEEVISRKIRYGTGNFLHEDAMTREEAAASLEAGADCARQMIQQGARLLILGEMGIGNTTPSSAMLAVLTGEPVEDVVGRGTGLADGALLRKKQIIRQAIESRQADPADPLDVLAKLGGLEIGAMAGAMLQAAAMRVPILVDGFISTVAALLAVRIEPRITDFMIVGHQSQEPGHKQALSHLRKQPLLDLELRLGEGTGAALAFPLVEAATRMLREMATFHSAGIAGKTEA